MLPRYLLLSRARIVFSLPLLRAALRCPSFSVHCFTSASQPSHMPLFIATIMHTAPELLPSTTDPYGVDFASASQSSHSSTREEQAVYCHGASVSRGSRLWGAPRPCPSAQPRYHNSYCACPCATGALLAPAAALLALSVVQLVPPVYPLLGPLLVLALEVHGVEVVEVALAPRVVLLLGSCRLLQRRHDLALLLLRGPQPHVEPVRAALALRRDNLASVRIYKASRGFQCHEIPTLVHDATLPVVFRRPPDA